MSKELKADKARQEEGSNVNRDKEGAAINVASMLDTFLPHIKAMGKMFSRK